METGELGQKPHLVTSHVAMATSIDTENAIIQLKVTEENIAVGHLLMSFPNATCNSVQVLLVFSNLSNYGSVQLQAGSRGGSRGGRRGLEPRSDFKSLIV